MDELSIVNLTIAINEHTVALRLLTIEVIKLNERIEDATTMSRGGKT